MFGYVQEMPKGVVRMGGGRKGFLSSDGVGFPVGIEGSTHMLLEIHYDNPRKLPGMTDSSGVSMTLTEAATEHEAGTLMVGDAGNVPGLTIGHTTDGIHILPNQRLRVLHRLPIGMHGCDDPGW